MTSDEADGKEESKQSSVCLICQDPEGMQDPVVLEDTSMGRQVFCYGCITRWLEVSSAGFTRAPHFYQTPFVSECCRLQPVKVADATYSPDYNVKVAAYERR